MAITQGKSIIIDGADFKPLPGSMHKSHVPPTFNGAAGLWFPDKLNTSVPDYLWVNPISATDPSKPNLTETAEFGTSTAHATIATPSVFGGKQALLFSNSANTKPYKANLNIDSTGFTVGIVYSIPSGVSLATDRRLFTFAGTDGKEILFRASGTGSVMLYNINVSTVLTTSSALALNTRYVVLFTFDSTTGTLKHYVNGSLINTFNTVDFTKLIGTLHIGAYRTGGAPFMGHLGSISIYSRVFSDTQVADYSTFLASAFS